MCVLANLCLRWSTLPSLSLPSFFILLPLCRFCIAGLYLPCSLVRLRLEHQSRLPRKRLLSLTRGSRCLKGSEKILRPTKERFTHLGKICFGILIFFSLLCRSVIFALRCFFRSIPAALPTVWNIFAITSFCSPRVV